MMNRLRTAVLCLVAATSAFAANIAVIDSGVDYKHVDLSSNMWLSSTGTVTDSDGKAYNGVEHGWNFAENNNQVIDYKYLGTFSADCYKIFEVQAKILGGTATQADKDWYTAKKNDATFLKELSKFGNFVHGTHVAGISAFEATDSRIQAVKLIATEPPGGLMSQLKAMSFGPESADNPLAKMFLTMMAKRQADLLIGIGKFVAGLDADVANGSFGVSAKAVAPVLKDFLKNILGKEPTAEEQKEYAIFFIQEIIKAAQGFVTTSSDTLFVFAAGNDGSNNDTLPVSPANIKTDNTIAVAATNGLTSLASFSNFGSQHVEVAAPGVAIHSTIPGDEHIRMSGTSMAAPFVTNVAGLVKDENASLNPAGIKQILIGTVDVKPFLQGKVSSGGIVNRDRAITAARLSRSMPLADAIATANRQVEDLSSREMPSVSEQDLVVLPLPSTL